MELVQSNAEFEGNQEEVAVTKPKRERKPKLDAEGNAIVKAPRAPKEPKAPKLYKQWNEDGSPLLDSEGEQVMLETKMTKPKKARAAAGPRMSKRFNISCNGESIAVAGLAEATIDVNSLTAREGSKRAEREAAFTGAATVQEFYANGGLNKDLLRLAASGAVSLKLDGVDVAVEQLAASTVEEAAAE